MIKWTDRKNCIAVITLDKCRIERAYIFELPKSLNIMRVFVYLTIKLFLTMGGGSDRKRSSQLRLVRTPQVIKAVRLRINQNPVQKQKIMAWEMDIVPRAMSRIIKQNLGLSNDKQDNAFCCIKRK